MSDSWKCNFLRVHVLNVDLCFINDKTEWVVSCVQLVQFFIDV